MPGESLETYVALARNVVPLLTTMHHPDDPSDAELLEAIRDGASPLDELEGPLRRYAIRQLSRGAPGRPANVYRDQAIRYFVKQFRRMGMSRTDAIDTIRDLLPVTLSTAAILSILRKKG